MTEIVTSLPHTFVAQDLSVVEMTFEFESGNQQTLRFATDLFDRFVSRADQLVATARSQTLATGDHLSVQAVEVADVSAHALAGGGRVLLEVVGSNGRPMRFALKVGHADRLRQKLYQASRAARKESSKPRH